ncbi:proB, partial [Symbiodinium sp. KB8]
MRIVIKVGTSSLLNDDGSGVRLGVLAQLCETVKELRAAGHETVIVSSGAVGMGCIRMGIDRPKEIGKVQAMAAVGGMALSRLFEQAFELTGGKCAQVLLTYSNFGSKVQFRTAKRAIEQLMAMEITPIVNENDVVSCEEAKGAQTLRFWGPGAWGAAAEAWGRSQGERASEAETWRRRGEHPFAPSWAPFRGGKPGPGRAKLALPRKTAHGLGIGAALALADTPARRRHDAALGQCSEPFGEVVFAPSTLAPLSTPPVARLFRAPLAQIGDNDNLAAMVATMVDAEVLVLLTDVDGLYTADPGSDPSARRIAR